VVGLIVAFNLPLVGAWLDHTPNRKRVGEASALLQVIIVLILCFLSEKNWFIMAIVQVFSAVTGWVHTLAIFAYLPELTTEATLLVKWTANFHLLQYITLILFLPLIIGILTLLGVDDNDIISARIALGVAFVLSLLLYTWVWTRLIQPRGALQTLPEGSSLWTIGFSKVWRTGNELFHRYRALMWFFMNVSLVEAAQTSLSVISLTYMTDQLQLSVTENAIAIFILFLFAALGTGIGQVSVRFMNPIRSNQLCQIFSLLVTTIAVLKLTGPGQKLLTYIVAALWGISAGWKNTVERFAITQIIPKDQDAEMMGFYLFASQVLIWCPTLIFTSLNEAGYDQRIGLGMLNVFFLGGIVCLFLMGSYDQAKDTALSNQNVNVGTEQDTTLQQINETVENI